MQNSPLGPLGPLIASVLAVLVVGAAVCVHILEAMGRAAGDPFLDTASLAILGVVLGVGLISGQGTTALAEAAAAHRRLDAIAAPAAVPTNGASS